jgi:hypothetical protein
MPGDLYREDSAQLEFPVSGKWESLASVLTAENGTCLLLGATDTGKTTLAKYPVSQLCRRGVRTALVDSDIGQSFLAPPDNDRVLHLRFYTGLGPSLPFSNVFCGVHIP